MLRVPAHTNTAGSFLKTSALQKRVISYNTLGVVTSNVSSVSNRNTQYSYKSILRKGAPVALVPGMLHSTLYQRQIGRLENVRDYVSKTRYSTGVTRADETGDGRNEILLASGLVYSGGVSSSTKNRAITECLNKVQDMKVDLGTALGEVKTTLNMVVSRITQLAKFIYLLRKFRFSEAFKVLFGGKSLSQLSTRDASNLFLEWRYGWSPLVSDVVSGVELIQTGFRDKSLLFKASRTITDYLDPASFTAYDSSLITEGEAGQSSRVELWGRVKSNASILGALGLVNPLSLAWELTTLSFVVDWLIPIGDWLQSLTATIGIEFITGHRTDVTWANLLVEKTVDIRSGAGGRYVQNPQVRLQNYSMTRDPYVATWPSSYVYWVNPLGSNFKHITSAIALLRQRT